jgi:hypothetical protein
MAGLAPANAGTMDTAANKAATLGSRWRSFACSDAAERPPCRMANVLRRHASTPKLIFEQREMRGDLACEVWFPLSGSNDVRQSEEESSPR